MAVCVAVWLCGCAAVRLCESVCGHVCVSVCVRFCASAFQRVAALHCIVPLCLCVCVPPTPQRQARRARIKAAVARKREREATKAAKAASRPVWQDSTTSESGSGDSDGEAVLSPSSEEAPDPLLTESLATFSLAESSIASTAPPLHGSACVRVCVSVSVHVCVADTFQY